MKTIIIAINGREIELTNSELNYYLNQYDALKMKFGEDRVKNTFPSGCNGFIYSIVIGHYSIDAIKQSLH